MSNMADDTEHQKFDSLSLKFSCLLYGRSEKHLQYINLLLDDFNNLNYKLSLVTNVNKAVLLIHQICTIVPSNNGELVKKSCILITHLINQQKVCIESKTLIFCIQWIIEYLKTNICHISVLQCLESLIRDNVHKIQEPLSDLISSEGILIKYSGHSELPEIQFWAVKCLEAISYCKDEKEPIISTHYLEICYKIFVSLLSEKHTKCDEVVYCKLLISCLRGLQTIINQTTNFESYDLGVLLGISRCYMTYTLFDSKWKKPQKILPSNLSIADLKSKVTREKKGGKVTKQRKQRRSNNQKKDDKKNDRNFSEATNSNYVPATSIADNIPTIVSDSDFSDSELGKKNKLSVIQGRVRQAALNLLLNIIKGTEKHVFYGFWSSFVYDGSPGNENNLNNCLLMEPSPRGRITVLCVLSTILNGSKSYLSQAEYSKKNFAFTPFSINLGSMVEGMHKSLCLSLKDNHIPILTQTLKCLALLVQATPYHRLSEGLISNVITTVKPFIRHRDTSVQVASLIVLGCIVASEPPVPETIQTISQNNSPKLAQAITPSDSERDRDIEYIEFSSDDEFSSNQPTMEELPWLLEKCLRNLGAVSIANKNSLVPAPVKLESLQVISALARNYLNILLAPHINLIAKAIEISLQDKYVDLRLHAGRAIDSIGHSIQQVSNLDNSNTYSVDNFLQFWLTLLNGSLPSLLQNEQNAILRSTGCDCLGTIGSDIFEHLPREKQLFIISLLFNCSRDEETSVKGAAVRALAISVLYPSLREDLGFIMDTTEAVIRNLSDSNLSVRIKSSWSLGNLSDALVLYKNNPPNEDLPDSLLYDLITNCIKVIDDNNKIKTNVLRALGNLLKLITSDMLTQDKFKLITEEAINVLVKNSLHSTDMKVRWNSCYAIGNFMKNNDLFSKQLSWEQNVYPVLMDLVSNFRNFKVRINAALALSTPEKKTHYSIYYFQIWKSLLIALENSENIDDYAEFNHRDNLVDQICLSLSHLSTFLANEDLFQLYEILVSHIDNFKIQMIRVHERLVPEKSEIFLKAANHVKILHENNLSKEQKSFLLELENIFVRQDQ